MGELKPEITVNEKWGNFSLQVDIDCPYTEDYQMKMLGHNTLQGILQVKGCEADKKSRYMYRTQGMTRLSRKFETAEIDRDGICALLEQVMAAADELKRYLLDPDCLLLAPECIFEKDGRYGFCYIPVRMKPLRRSLHELTGFFLEKLDYRDTEGVFLACLLHKETMREGYDLAEILRKYKEEEAARLHAPGKACHDAAEADGDLFIVDEEGTGVRGYCARPEKTSYSSCITGSAPMVMREEGKTYGPLKKLGRRLKTGYWGNWGDLITEAKEDEHQPA